MSDKTPSDHEGDDSIPSSPKGDPSKELPELGGDSPAKSPADNDHEEEKSDKGSDAGDKAGRKGRMKKLKEIDYNKDDAASEGSGIDYFAENDDEEYQEKKKKKKKKKEKKDKERDRSQSNHKRKKQKKDEEAEEDFVDGTESDVERELKKRARKIKKDKIDEEQVQADIQQLIAEMEDAYQEDLACIENKKPALNKLKLLPKVDNQLKKVKYQEKFVDLTFRGLDFLTKWLSKLPDGSQPSLPIRKKLVEIIATLPVTEESIKTSDLGKILFEMRSNPSEDIDIKKSLKDIIDKWTRILTDAPAEYKSYRDDSGNIKRVNVSLDQLQVKSMSSLRASIPRLVNKKVGYDYVKKPPQIDPKNFKTGGFEECDKLMFDLKRKMKKDFK